MIAIGVDPGVTTGLAVWDAEQFKFRDVTSMSILKALQYVRDLQGACRFNNVELFVIVEDARKRKGGFKKADEDTEKYGPGVREAVGSVKRDCSIWEEFLREQQIPFELKYPRRTKRSPDEFARLSGWSDRTNKHQRDAGMIVLQLNKTMLRLKLQTFQIDQQQRDNANESTLPAGVRLRRGRKQRRR